jgi:hypothetical protein
VKISCKYISKSCVGIIVCFQQFLTSASDKSISSEKWNCIYSTVTTVSGPLNGIPRLKHEVVFGVSTLKSVRQSKLMAFRDPEDNIECPTGYRTRHFFNNSNTNEDRATKFEQEYVRCVRNEKECACSVCL